MERINIPHRYVNIWYRYGNIWYKYDTKVTNFFNAVK